MSPATLMIVKSPHKFFSQNLARIARLRSIAFDLERAEVDHPNAKQILLRQSYIVYLIAMWQDFIQSLTLDAAVKLLALSGHDRPRENIWTEIVKGKFFNTPDMANIDRVVRNATRMGSHPGIHQISVYWKWPGMSPKDAGERLEKLLHTRHQLAHTGKSSQLPSFEEAIEEMDFLFKLGGIMQSEIDKYVAEQKRQAN